MMRCPCCGGLMFEDMDRCYECMHPVRSDAAEGPGRESGEADRADPIMADLSCLGDISRISIDEASWAAASADGAEDDASGAEAAPDAGDPPECTEWELTVRVPGTAASTLTMSGGGSEIRVGRSGDNEICIPDPRVSRHHALVFESGGRLWVRDLGSRNMTFLGGFPVVGTMLLGEGAKLGVGPASITARRVPPVT